VDILVILVCSFAHFSYYLLDPQDCLPWFHRAGQGTS
jgi:hypothetical protein